LCWIALPNALYHEESGIWAKNLMKLLKFFYMQVCAVYNGLGLFWVMQSEYTNYRNRHLPTAALSGVNKSKNRYTDVLARIHKAFFTGGTSFIEGVMGIFFLVLEFD
jgi:hypothetical protein